MGIDVLSVGGVAGILKRGVLVHLDLSHLYHLHVADAWCVQKNVAVWENMSGSKRGMQRMEDEGVW